MNRASRGFRRAGQGSPEGLDPLDCTDQPVSEELTAFTSVFCTVTNDVWDDKELPNVPLVADLRD